MRGGCATKFKLSTARDLCASRLRIVGGTMHEIISRPQPEYLEVADFVFSGICILNLLAGCILILTQLIEAILYYMQIDDWIRPRRYILHVNLTHETVIAYICMISTQFLLIQESFWLYFWKISTLFLYNYNYFTGPDLKVAPDPPEYSGQTVVEP